MKENIIFGVNIFLCFEIYFYRDFNYVYLKLKFTQEIGLSLEFLITIPKVDS